MSMYQGYSQEVTPTPPPTHILHSSYPVHPDVRLKKLPFFDVLYELIRPSTLDPGNSISGNSSRMNLPTGPHVHMFMFHLSPLQGIEISMSKNTSAGIMSEYGVQVQMRFCLVETSCEQEDCFPPGLSVRVNGKYCTLPNPIPAKKTGVEPKRPSKPLNITNLVTLSPTKGNVVTVMWAPSHDDRQYAAAITIVRKLTPGQLLQRLRSKGIRHADFTTGLIKQKLRDENDLELLCSTLRVSLMCPLGKMRMQTPCRSTICSHLQCFDASVFLQMNELKSTWVCPVCDKPCLYDSLSIDGYFQDMLKSSQLPPDANAITLHQDGTWSTSSAVKEEVGLILVEIDDDDDDDDDSDTPMTSSCIKDAAAVGTTRKEEFVDLTLSDSDSDDKVTLTSVTASGQAASKPATDAGGTAPTTPAVVYNWLSSTDSNSSVEAGGGGRSPVTSSGYISPNIINLDSTRLQFARDD